MLSLKGKKVVVTGSSRGIGSGIAKSLASLGAQVCVTYSRSKDKAEEVFSSLEGDGHLLLSLNTSDEESIKSFFKEVLDKWESIDGLVNNAGITRDQLLLRMKTSDFDEVYETNLKGTFLCTKAVAKPMMKKRTGSIVNITSVIGSTGNPGQANYAASKAGTEAFSKSVAKELGSRGIRANCVAPGFIQTEMTDILDDKQKDALTEQLPLARLGTTDDVAQAVAFLISDASSYITGQTIHVNGGMYLN
ncbi:MAG: 3-oxoacyl-[acyl-carrier-protein] reductase [Bdellovibrionales bacterium]